MTEQTPPNLPGRFRVFFWPAVLIGFLAAKVVLSLAVKPDSVLSSGGAINYLLLLLLATGFALRNGIRNTLGNRLFWVFLAIAYGLWALDQVIFLWYEFGPHIEVPDNSIADPLLFLHVVLLMAVVTTLPNQNPSGRNLYRAILNCLLLLFFWSFLYVYAVFPYQYLFPNGSSYALRFDVLYLLANLLLILAVGIASLRAPTPWKKICLHLLGASTLYALSSAVANTAIDTGGYVAGKLYGLGLTASACWFVWIPLRARQFRATKAGETQFDSHQGSQMSAWVMFAVVMITIPVVWGLFRSEETPGMRTFRLLAAIAAIVCLAGVAYIKEYLAKSELASQLVTANDRLRLAVESGKSVGWESDFKTGRDSWFGDLQTMFGISSDASIGKTGDFYRYLDPEDRQLVAKAIANARQERKEYTAEFRIVRPDGTARWVSATGKFYYGTNGDAERMLGLATDITERKRAEEALRDNEDKLRLILDSTAEAIYGIDLESRCTFCNSACLRTLGHERVDQLLGRDMHLLLHHTRKDGIPFPVDECRIVRVTRTGEGVHVDDEVLWRANGTSFPAEYWCYPQWRGQEVVGAVVAFVDITQRKQSEAALALVSGKLIEAQEQERSRIARELHDDIGQRLALLAIGLAQLQQSATNSSKLPGSIGELRKQTSEIAADIQSLSHELHSSRLQYLGIVAAMRGFCREFSEQQKVEVDFNTHDVPLPLSPDVSLCFFRILQEALHNAAKHSGVRHFEVRLWGTPDEIHLTASDSGSGFDIEAAKRTRGLGLVSMEERLKLVKGTLAIESQLQHGTMIHARVPLREDLIHVRVAG
jgi:PAS domain S-box-containing protein